MAFAAAPVVMWWVRAHGPCRMQVLRLGQETCLVCGQRNWCGRGDAPHTWEHNAAPAAGSNLPAITFGGLGEAHAWAVVRVRAGQVPPARPARSRRLRDRVWSRGTGPLVEAPRVTEQTVATPYPLDYRDRPAGM